MDLERPNKAGQSSNESNKMLGSVFIRCLVWPYTVNCLLQHKQQLLVRMLLVTFKCCFNKIEL